MSIRQKSIHALFAILFGIAAFPQVASAHASAHNYFSGTPIVSEQLSVQIVATYIASNQMNDRYNLHQIPANNIEAEMPAIKSTNALPICVYNACAFPTVSENAADFE